MISPFTFAAGNGVDTVESYISDIFTLPAVYREQSLQLFVLQPLVSDGPHSI
jgi:hypothetical protein